MSKWRDKKEKQREALGEINGISPDFIYLERSWCRRLCFFFRIKEKQRNKQGEKRRVREKNRSGMRRRIEIETDVFKKIESREVEVEVNVNVKVEVESIEMNKMKRESVKKNRKA